MEFDKPNIFICGQSGTGKSTSLENLDPERTIVLNTERKQLPFPKAGRFERRVMIDNLELFDASLDKALVAKNCDQIIIDSFTSYVELVNQKTIQSADESGDQWPWQTYKNIIHNTLLKSKVVDRYVVFLGIDQITNDEQMRRFKTVDIQGGLKSKVEKEFEIVLWTKVVQGENGFEYKFVTNSDTSNTAKSPRGMFTELLIDNDLNEVFKSIESYYTGEQQ